MLLFDNIWIVSKTWNVLCTTSLSSWFPMIFDWFMQILIYILCISIERWTAVWNSFCKSFILFVNWAGCKSISAYIGYMHIVYAFSHTWSFFIYIFIVFICNCKVHTMGNKNSYSQFHTYMHSAHTHIPRHLLTNILSKRRGDASIVGKRCGTIIFYLVNTLYLLATNKFKK